MILKYMNNNNKFYNIKEVAKKYFHISDKLIVKLKNKQKIFLNGNTSTINQQIFNGDLIEFDLNYEEESENIIPVKMNLDIIFEDDCMIIVNKSSNMPIHPSFNHYTDSLSNGIKYYFNTINLKKKIRPVNRLDKDTSGLVIFAKNEYIQENLINQMKTGDFKKEYIAILEGTLPEKQGTINLPIARKAGSIIEREINYKIGQEAITSYKVILEKNNLSIVKFKLETGRTHQIRVHSKYMNAPILGDTLYNKKSDLINRQALHAFKIEFIHPISKRKMSFETNLPKDIFNIFNTHIDFEENK